MSIYPCGVFENDCSQKRTGERISNSIGWPATSPPRADIVTLRLLVEDHLDDKANVRPAPGVTVVSCLPVDLTDGPPGAPPGVALLTDEALILSLRSLQALRRPRRLRTLAAQPGVLGDDLSLLP